MRRVPPALLVAVLFSGAVRAADDPRALVERSIKAEGGPEHLARRYPFYARYQGSFYVKGGQRVPVSSEVYDARDGRLRMVLHVNLGGAKQDVTVVLNIREGWRSVNGTVTHFTGEEKSQFGTVLHLGRVAEMVDLLRDKGFTLAPAGEVKVEGRPARGVKVSYKGQPDVTLYFDKETGLTSKVVYRGKEFGEAQEAKHESVNLDWQVLDYGAADERRLKAARVDTSGPGLIAFLRVQTAGRDRVALARKLVRQLGDDSFEVREKASGKLVALGDAARGPLEEAAKDRDPEVSRRARHCLEKLGSQTSEELVAAAVRLMAVRRPKGAVAALLDYLPGADPRVVREVRSALYALARPDGKPDPVLVKALEDKDLVRRAAAVSALGSDGGAYAKQPGRRVYPPGVKEHRKSISYADGEKVKELEIVDMQFFNRLDDSLFAKR